MKFSLKILTLFISLFICCNVYASETLVIKGSDTLGAKMVPQLAEAFKAKMKDLGKKIAFDVPLGLRGNRPSTWMMMTKTRN